jgi:glutamyl-tRNA synthetase
MNDQLIQRIESLLFGDVQLPTRAEIEDKYQPRAIPNGAEVTRLCPSPTGFVHIGTIFTAQLCQFVARQSGGVYILRIEDTDKKREVAGAKELIAQQLKAFSLTPDEGLTVDGTQVGSYGPYIQSERKLLYWSFVRELLRNGRAYPCFASAEELQDAVKDQQMKKLRPGYYGEWALWRDRSDEDIEKMLNQEVPFVVRFKSMGSHDKRISYDDVLKGHLELPENDLDVPLLKSDEYRLPTYHFAHVVDDYLMRATIVMRGEEWLPSTPLHFELCDALQIPHFRYAHTPVISIIDPQGGGKRKLSKRKDPEADVAFWLKLAYPIKSVKAYLLGLANSNFEDWYRENPDVPLEEFPFNLERLRTSRSPLLDMKKVEDYAKDEIARMPQQSFNKHILEWSELHDLTLFTAMMANPEYTASVLAIERGGDKPRKDVAKWSDATEQFGYFYDDIFEMNILPTAQCENEIAFSDTTQQVLNNYLELYDYGVDKDTWFENMKKVAVASGYCLDRKELKEQPEKYKGGIADFAGILRLRLTGKTRTPDLYTIMQVMGEERVRRRLSAN